MPYNNSENTGYSAYHSVNAAGLDRDTLINKLGALWENNRQYLTLRENTGCYYVGFTALADSHEQAEAMSANAVTNIKNRLKGFCYGVDGEGLEEIVFSLLKNHSVTVSTAEYYGNGQISADFTEINDGKRGTVSASVKHIGNYKIDKFGIDPNNAEEHGAVSPQLAAKMAYLVREKGGSDIGLSVCCYLDSGNAEDAHADSVCFGLYDGERIWVKTARFNTENATDTNKFIKEHAAALLLNMLRLYLSADDDFLNLGAYANADLKVTDAFTGEVAVHNYKLCDFVSEHNNYVSGSKKTRRAKDKKRKKSFWKCIIPQKGDKVIDIILKIIAIIAAVTFIASASYIANYYLDSNEQQNLIVEAKDTVDFSDQTFNEETQTYSKFDELYAHNNDFRGWISINNTKVDNPVYQHTDNEYYIKYNMDKKRNSHGALFIDSNCILTGEKKSQNLIIYGHSMQDGTMFGTLKRYRRLAFYKENPTISFETLYTQPTEYKIFSVFVTNSTPEQNDGYVFNYTMTDFKTDSTFLAWINDVKERSFFDIGVDVEATDEIITLSTCDYDFDGARLVIVARKTRDGESASVDVSSAAINPDPIMPQGWYKVYG